MPVLKRLEDFLKENSIKYKSIVHSEAYTSQEIAAAMHISGKDLAKSVIFKAGDRFIMAVLPASSMVDMEKFKVALNEKDIRLATEKEFQGLFPDSEPGAEPPFGNLYKIDTIVDKTLAEDESIYFNAGNHYEAVEMYYKDYARLVKPKVADFSSPFGKVTKAAS